MMEKNGGKVDKESLTKVTYRKIASNLLFKTLGLVRLFLGLVRLILSLVWLGRLILSLGLVWVWLG